MGGIKVIGHSASTATRGVLIALHEKGLEFELVHVKLKDGEQKMEMLHIEPFLLGHPFGTSFEHGNLNLSQSRGITQYIADAYSDKGNQLLPIGSKNTAFVDVVMELESHQFNSAALKLVWEQIFKPRSGSPIDQDVVKEEEVKLAKVLDSFEARLSKSKYMVCDHFTLVDLHHIPVIQYLLGTPTKKLFDERPHVNAWVADITSRPSSKMILLLKDDFNQKD